MINSSDCVRKFLHPFLVVKEFTLLLSLFNQTGISSYRKRKCSHHKAFDCGIDLTVFVCFLPPDAPILARTFLFISLHPNVDRRNDAYIHNGWLIRVELSREQSRRDEKFRALTSNIPTNTIRCECVYKNNISLLHIFLHLSALKSSRICFAAFWTLRRFADLYMYEYALHMAEQSRAAR